ncbi:MAG: exodeoxyribonuclease VII small subunit [Myxococcota bacterium]
MPREDATPDPGELGFEAALERLEDLAEQLESGDLPLEEALATFEAGVALTRQCNEQLEAAERRIEVLVREGGGLVAKPFEDDAPPGEGG